MKQSAMTDTDTMQMVSDTGEKIIYYTCPMEAHSYVRTDISGKCPQCGMELKLMRLKKMEKM
jgi:hypothetical protein